MTFTLISVETYLKRKTSFIFLPLVFIETQCLVGYCRNLKLNVKNCRNIIDHIWRFLFAIRYIELTLRFRMNTVIKYVQ